MTTGCCTSMRFPAARCVASRILRLFSNVSADGAPRAWRVGEPFPDFARQFLPRTGSAMPGSAWLLQRLGITKGRRSEYDRVMLRLHDTGKLDAAYQSGAPRSGRVVCRRHHVALLHGSGAARGTRRALRTGTDLPPAGHGDGASGAFAAAGARATGRPRADIAQPIGGQSGVVPPRDQRDGDGRKHRSQCSHGKRCRKRPCDQQAGER